MKTLEDFADKILKTLNPGLPFGKVHPQKLKLLEVLERREKQTRTAVLDEIEREVEAGDLTRKFMESLEHPTPEEYYAYNQGIADIKAIIQSKRTEI